MPFLPPASTSPPVLTFILYYRAVFSPTGPNVRMWRRSFSQYLTTDFFALVFLFVQHWHPRNIRFLNLCKVQLQSLLCQGERNSTCTTYLYNLHGGRSGVHNDILARGQKAFKSRPCTLWFDNILVLWGNLSTLVKVNRASAANAFQSWLVSCYIRIVN